MNLLFNRNREQTVKHLVLSAPNRQSRSGHPPFRITHNPQSARRPWTETEVTTSTYDASNQLQATAPASATAHS